MRKDYFVIIFLAGFFLIFAGCASQSVTIRYEPQENGLALARQTIFILKTTTGEKFEIYWQPEYPLLTEDYFYGYYINKKDDHLYHLKVPREEIKYLKMKEPSQWRRFLMSGGITYAIVSFALGVKLR